VDERAAFSQRKLELDGRLVAIAMPDPPPAEPTRPTGPTASSSSAASPTDPALEEEEGGSSPGSPGSTDKPGTAKTSAPVEVDSGDGEDLVGADLKR
jgi:hypothetical protein